ncbi:thiamine diphosphokinase [Actibacterium sp. XHP0104]|uniref:thiamine diphosphokinase n=1 Tax=Actibacterium sp. XHP0104 TaxID=2984335 RepID=UPI0039945935
MWSFTDFRSISGYMSHIFQSKGAVTLLGGGACRGTDLAEALSLAPCLVAADGGADRALALGHVPKAVIGDMDSISPQTRAAIAPGRLHHIPEQDSTDFDKALRNIDAPLVLGLGMLGPRADHMLAALNVLHRHSDRRCILISDSDVVFLAPPQLTLDLPRDARVSLFPMAPITGRSTGLYWPIDGIEFTPGGRVGTSNQAQGGPVTLGFDAPGMIVLLDRAGLGAAVAALV